MNIINYTTQMQRYNKIYLFHMLMLIVIGIFIGLLYWNIILPISYTCLLLDINLTHDNSKSVNFDESTSSYLGTPLWNEVSKNFKKPNINGHDGKGPFQLQQIVQELLFIV